MRERERGSENEDEKEREERVVSEAGKERRGRIEDWAAEID